MRGSVNGRDKGLFIQSHPGRPLEDHLTCTYKLAEELSLRFLGTVPPRLREVCLLHDIAKAHRRFQASLYGKGKFPHAEPSAGIALAITRDIVAAEVIRCHHTRLADEFFDNVWYNLEYKKLAETVKEIPVWDGSRTVTEPLEIAVEKWEQLLPSSEEWDDLIFEIEDELVLDTDLWFGVKLLYSLLITADRLDAVSGGEEDYPFLDFQDPGNAIERYVSRLKDTPLTKWRKKVRREVLDRATTLFSKPGVYTLTLPTGAGKTLLALEIALRILRQQGKKSIIYVLPFITIVEQNSAIARDIFSFVQEDHHLAYEGNPEEKQSHLDRFVSLFRYWKEPVVVSTFAKLWEVLYSPRANDAMSFHRLANAVVLLDEPQSIPARYWKGFGETLNFLVEKMNTTFILITATQPNIAQGIELTPSHISLPRNRYSLFWSNGTYDIQKLPDLVNRHVPECKNTMVVVNTRKAALEVLFSIRNGSMDIENPFFLSGWVAPFDRKRTLSEIKAREEKSLPRNLVATQVVEAGVDLDFHLVFRDIAPMDSLVQVAGRCNRHMSDFEGRVIVFTMTDENGRGYATTVYDPVLLNVTKEVLGSFEKGEGARVYSEFEVKYLLDIYYRKLKGALQDEGPWFEIQEGKWDCNAFLFHEPINESTVLIDRDGEIGNLLKEIEDIGNRLEDRDKRKKLWGQLQEHAISVPEAELEKWSIETGAFIIDEHEEEQDIEKVAPGMWTIKPNGFGKIYRPDIGFVPYSLYEKYCS